MKGGSLGKQAAGMILADITARGFDPPWHKRNEILLGEMRFSPKKTSWWVNQPIWKICSSNWIISPRIGVKIKKYLKPPTRNGCSQSLLKQVVFTPSMKYIAKVVWRHCSSSFWCRFRSFQLSFPHPCVLHLVWKPWVYGISSLSQWTLKKKVWTLFSLLNM